MKSIKTKKILSTISITVLIFALIVSWVCVGFLSNGFNDWSSKPNQTAQINDDITAVDDNGKVLTGDTVHAMPVAMTFRSASMLSGNAISSVTLKATVLPEAAANKAVRWSSSFVNPSSTWATGKSVDDYLTVRPLATGDTTATIECVKPFGEQIKITVTSEDNPNAKAECTVDFAARLEERGLAIKAYANEDDEFPTMYLLNWSGSEFSKNVYMRWDELFSSPFISASFTMGEGTITDSYQLNISYTFTEEIRDLVHSAYDGYHSNYMTYDVFSGALSTEKELGSQLLEGWEVISQLVDFMGYETARNVVGNYLQENPNTPVAYMDITITGQYSSYAYHLPMIYAENTVYVVESVAFEAENIVL